jgi:hypothetical protein
MIVVAPQSVDLPAQPDQPTDRGYPDQDLRQPEGARYCCVVRPGREEEGKFSHVGVLSLKASGHA